LTYGVVQITNTSIDQFVLAGGPWIAVAVHCVLLLLGYDSTRVTPAPTMRAPPPRTIFPGLQLVLQVFGLVVLLRLEEVNTS
jgi:hypothetical protein